MYVGTGLVLCVALASVDFRAALEPAGVRQAEIASPTPPTELPPSSYGARPPQGVALRGSTGLRLVTASPWAVVDVDGGGARPVVGLRAQGGRPTWVETAGPIALVKSGTRIHLLRSGSTRAAYLFRAADLEPTRDGQAVWVRSVNACSVRQLGLDGEGLRSAVRIPCDAVPMADLPAGLLLWLPSDGPASGLVTTNGFRRLTRVVDGVVRGNLVLSAARQGRPITLLDLATHRSFQVRWPSRLGSAGRFVDAHPGGRLVAVGFYDSDPVPLQAVDIWVLDLVTRRWQQLPGMPIRLARKPRLGWTGDGRLAILAHPAGREGALVAVWRPGESSLGIREVPLPGNADTLSLW